MTKMLVFLSLWVPFAAFSQNVKLTIQSTPDHAAIMVAGAKMGVTPATLTYHASEKFTSGECTHTMPVTLQWADGRSNTARIKVCPDGGNMQQAIFTATNGAVVTAKEAWWADEARVAQNKRAARPSVATKPTQQVLRQAAFERSQARLAAKLAAAKARLRATNAAIRRQRNERALMQAAGELGGILGGAAAGVPYAPYVPVTPMAPYPTYPTNRYRDNHITCTSTSNGGFAPSVTTDCH